MFEWWGHRQNSLPRLGMIRARRSAEPNGASRARNRKGAALSPSGQPNHGNQVKRLSGRSCGPGGKGLPRHSIFISRLSLVTRLDGIRRLFVESIEGSNGALSLDQLKALVTNSGRFELVEDIKLADAVLKGRSEARDIGSTYKGLERGKRSAAVGTIAGLAMGGATSRAVTESKTETLVAESLLLRLTLASGESVWAWDDSLTCTRPKAQCAVAALVAEATK